MAGKVEWLASGLPTEGKEAAAPRASDRVRRDLPTCRLTDRLGDVTRQVQASGWDRAVVINEARVVLGLLHGKAWDDDPERRVEQIMDPGPSTFRPDVALAELAAYMQQRGIDNVLITTADGKLVGLLEHSAAA